MKNKMEKKEMREIGEEEFTRIKKSGLCGINSDFIVVEVLDGGVKKYWYVPREKDKEFGEYLQSIAPRYTQKELDKAREDGKREQAELDRVLYSVSFEHIKNADFERILLESVKKAKEGVLERVALETKANVCECGEKWSETDLGIWVEEELSKLKDNK
jgi:hypothetical protein